MSPVVRFELLLGLLMVVVALELVARRLRMPPAAAFILGGIALALTPGVPEFELDPDLVLVLFLPPLLLSGAYSTAWRDFRADLRVILQLAIGAVVFTTLAVGWVTHLVSPSLPWAACFALGAVVSPPDAVAAKAVLQGVPLPRRVIQILEGESLVNDASGLVLFRFAVAASLTGVFSAGQAAVSFASLTIGGVLAGIGFGIAASFVFARVRDVKLGIVCSFLAAWGSYIAADAVGVSGVLSTVSCGLIIGWRQHVVLGAAARTQAGAVWGVAEFILESLVFILIGLSLRGVLARLGGSWDATTALLPGIAAIVGTVIVSRFIWVIPTAYLPRLAFPSLRRRDPYPPLSVPLVVSWAGMRGVVSLAAALSLPEGFPGRDLILTVTFVVILVTVLVQGATLAPLIRALRLDHFQMVAAEKTLNEAEARALMAAEQLTVVEKHSLAEDGSHRHPRLLEHYSYRAKAASRYSEAAGGLEGARIAHFSVVLAAIAAGRATLLHLHRSGRIHDTVLNILEEELDLEEMSVRRFASDQP